MSPRELRLRQRIDALMERVEDLERQLRNSREYEGRWRRQAGGRYRARNGEGTARYRSCSDCGVRCRGTRCRGCYEVLRYAATVARYEMAA